MQQSTAKLLLGRISGISRVTAHMRHPSLSAHASASVLPEAVNASTTLLPLSCFLVRTLHTTRVSNARRSRGPSSSTSSTSSSSPASLSDMDHQTATIESSNIADAILDKLYEGPLTRPKGRHGDQQSPLLASDDGTQPTHSSGDPSIRDDPNDMKDGQDQARGRSPAGSIQRPLDHATLESAVKETAGGRLSRRSVAAAIAEAGPPGSYTPRTVDERHAAGEELSASLLTQLETEARERLDRSKESLGDTDLPEAKRTMADRRAAVMELYDTRHEYIDQESEKSGKSQQRIDDWFVDTVHGVQVPLAREPAGQSAQAASVPSDGDRDVQDARGKIQAGLDSDADKEAMPRWMRGIQTAERRSAGLGEVVDEQAEAQALEQMLEQDGTASPETLLAFVVSTIRAERGQNLNVIDVREKCDHTDYMVIVEGRSSKQIYSIADGVRRKVRDILARDASMPDHLTVQGAETDDWMVLDMGAVILNCFTPDARKFYDLDDLWMNMDPRALDRDFAMEPDSDRDSL